MSDCLKTQHVSKLSVNTIFVCIIFSQNLQHVISHSLSSFIIIIIIIIIIIKILCSTWT